MISKKLKDSDILKKINLSGPAKWWRNFKYFFRRKNSQIRNVLKFVPMLWKQFDFDYHYATDLFSFQLKKMAAMMESDRAMSTCAPFHATRIRTAIKLMDKVYDEDYALEYFDKIIEMYGKEAMEITFEDTGDGTDRSYMKHKYELTETPEKIAEIEAMSSKLRKESRLKQEKAHRILWAFIEHNIQHWWD